MAREAVPPHEEHFVAGCEMLDSRPNTENHTGALETKALLGGLHKTHRAHDVPEVQAHGVRLDLNIITFEGLRRRLSCPSQISQATTLADAKNEPVSAVLNQELIGEGKWVESSDHAVDDSVLAIGIKGPVVFPRPECLEDIGNLPCQCAQVIHLKRCHIHHQLRTKRSGGTNDLCPTRAGNA